MAQLQPYDPYTKRVLPDEFVSPAWSLPESSITSTAPGTSGSNGGEVVFDQSGDGPVVGGGL